MCKCVNVEAYDRSKDVLKLSLMNKGESREVPAIIAGVQRSKGKTHAIIVVKDGPNTLKIPIEATTNGDQVVSITFGCPAHPDSPSWEKDDSGVTFVDGARITVNPHLAAEIAKKASERGTTLLRH